MRPFSTQIGKTEWSVDGNTPTLEAAQNTYMFALTDGRFLSLLLHRGNCSLRVSTANGRIA